jgi:uncharacterized protein (DUF433 family)
MKTTVSERISIDAQVCHGKPVVTGTRVPVGNVVGALSAGQSIASVLEDYPTLTEADVHACLAFAGRLAQFEMCVA